MREGSQALTRARLQAAAGARVDPTGLPSVAVRAVAVAGEVGAPLVPALDAAAAAHEQASELAGRVAAALAPARTVATALLALPAVTVPLLGRLLDLDLLAFYGTPVGMVVAGVVLVLWGSGGVAIATLLRSVRGGGRGGGLAVRVVTAAAGGWLVAGEWLAAAAAVAVRLVWRPAPPPTDVAVAAAAELVATALSGGASIPAALRTAARHLPEAARELRRLALVAELGRLDQSREQSAAVDPLAELLADGVAYGAPLAPALRQLARRIRADHAAAARAAAERLPARLVFPTALCLLPATVLAIGAPVVVAGLGAVSST